MNFFHKKLKATLLLIGIIIFTIPTFAIDVTANAGPDKELNITASNNAVYLEGSGTGDGNLTYKWYEGSKYIGPHASRWYVITQNGEHEITLVVTDANGNEANDTMIVTVNGGIDNNATTTLTANAGPDKELNITASNNAVYLEGSATGGEEPLTYKWYEGNKYIGPHASRWYVITQNGEHEITLVVTDANGSEANDTMIVTVNGGTDDSLFIEKPRFKKVGNHSEYIPPLIKGFTHYNRDYYEYCKTNNLPVQESPWGFQEMNLSVGVVTHNIHTAQELYDLLKPSSSEKYGIKNWGDNKVHHIKLDEGVYDFTDFNISSSNYTYYFFYLPSKTIIEGAGKNKTIIIPPKTYKAGPNGEKIFGDNAFDSDKLKNNKLFFFWAEGPKVYDIVFKDLYFKTTKLRTNPQAEWDKYEIEDNRWMLWKGRSRGHGMENLLFENIKTDSMFSPSGATDAGDFKDRYFTIRGVEKTVGSTVNKLKALITKYGNIQTFNDGTPGLMENNVQFCSNPYNKKNTPWYLDEDEARCIRMSEQLALAEVNSVVVHNCKLGETVSATIDFYGNYIELVGNEFRDVQYDHIMKNPGGNHIYMHDNLYYLDKNYHRQYIVNGSWNPSLFRLEQVDNNQRQSMHFKNLTLKQKERFNIFWPYKRKDNMQFSKVIQNRFGGFPAFSVYAEFTKDDSTTAIHDNKSGDLIWENISFEGVIPKEYGFTNVQTDEGWQAIVYNKKSGERIDSAFQKDATRDGNFSNNDPMDQISYYDDRLVGENKIVEERSGSSMADITGVYSWGQWSDGYIDFARDNSSRHAYDNNNTYDPDLNGQFKLKSDSIQAPYYNAQNTSAAKVIEAIHGGDFIKE